MNRSHNNDGVATIGIYGGGSFKGISFMPLKELKHNAKVK